MPFDRWNSHRKNNNCYAFAFGHFDEDAPKKLQPGELSGRAPLRDTEYSCSAFVERVLEDNPAAIRASAAQCPPGMYRVALFLDREGKARDYHFYRQVRAGAWAHKPGSLPVTMLDDSGHAITDPLTADRDYVNNGDEADAYNYAEYCTSFCVPGNVLPAPSAPRNHWRWLLLGVVLALVALVIAFAATRATVSWKRR